MLIEDLPCLENVARDELVFGRAAIASSASAWGDDTFTFTDTDLEVRNKKNGQLKLRGEATALAIGEDPFTATYYNLDCFSNIKIKTFSREGENFAYENLRIKAKF